MTSKGSQTRQHIIDQCLQLFSVKGYHNTSVSDILEATGLTRGGLYAHFKSKEDIWWSVYEEAIKIWRSVVFKDIRKIDDPIDRLEAVIENDMRNYLGANIFEGGCFLLNTLVELSGQSPEMGEEVLRGFVGLTGLMKSWIEEADERGLLRPGIDPEEVATAILVALNGVAALYAATRNPLYWELTLKQLRTYLHSLRKESQ